MKRYGNLWPHIIEFENLYRAAAKAQKGKRFQPNVLKFNFNLCSEIKQLQRELIHHTYCPGPYYTFEISDPKRRLISAAPYRDRVVHHALCNIIEPIMDRTLIGNTYANRIGYGTGSLRGDTELKALLYKVFTGLASKTRKYRLCKGLRCFITR